MIPYGTGQVHSPTPLELKHIHHLLFLILPLTPVLFEASTLTTPDRTEVETPHTATPFQLNSCCLFLYSGHSLLLCASPF